MKLGYMALIGILMIVVLVAGCAGSIPLLSPNATVTSYQALQPISIYNMNISGTVTYFSAQDPVGVVHDNASFTIKNNGKYTLHDLRISYWEVTKETALNPQGVPYTANYTSVSNNPIGSLYPGESKNIVIPAYQYPTTAEAVYVTIKAYWNEGSQVLYSTTLMPGFGGNELA